MNKKKTRRLLPAGSLVLAVLIALSSLCLSSCDSEGSTPPGTEVGTASTTEAPINAIYYTGFEETDNEKFTVGDFGIDPTAAAASSKYSNWSLTAPYDGEHGSIQIKKLNGNQVLSLSNSGEKEEYDNTIQLRLGGFDNLDEVWVSYTAAFSSKTTFAALPAPCGTGWATCVGNNAGAWAWSSKEGKWRGLDYADFSGILMEATKWYTVEVHYAKGDSKATVEVYIDGQLTKAEAHASFNEQVNGLLLELNNQGVGDCELFIDNIAVSAERLAGVQVPASVVDIEEVTDVAIIAAELTAMDGKADTYSMAVGDEVLASAKIAPANADYQNVLWSSEDPSIVTVYPSGQILALSPGTTVITAASAEPESTICDKITVVVTEESVMKTMQVTSVDELKAALAEVASINAGSGMTGNIEIVLADGNYYLTETLKLGLAHSGTNGYSLIIKAAENAEPVISGATVITGTWTKVDGKDYYATQVPKDIVSRHLFVNNVRATRARSEDGLANLKTVKDADGNNIGFASNRIELASYRYPEDLEFVYKQQWTQPRCGVAQILDNQDGTVNVIMDQPGWGFVNNKGGTSVGNSNSVWYENALELLDKSGEWYLDIHSSEEYNTLYYMPRPWENLETAYVTMPTLDNSVDIDGADGALVAISGTFLDAARNEVDTQVTNIRFDGITFADTTWMRPSTGYGVSDAQNNHIREHGDILAPGAVTVEAANSIWFTGCTFTRLGINGLQMINGVQDSMIIGNHFYDISGNAINIGDPDTGAANAHAQGLNIMQNNDILNNFIHNIGVDYGSSAAISVGFAADMDMNHNEIFDIPYSGWHIGYGWSNHFPNNTKNMRLEYNFIHDNMNAGIFDGGAFYINGNTSGEGYNYIQHNYVRKQMNAHGALYPDEGATWFNFVENVIDMSESPDWHNGQPKWSHTHQAGGHIHYINNFSTTDYYFYKKFPGVATSEEDIHIEMPKLSTDANWTDPVALEVIAHAGLESAYSDLRNGQVERFEVLADGAACGSRKGLELGGKLQLSVTASAIRSGELVTEGLNCNCYYESSDPAVAEVDASGLVVAKSVGSTTIRVWVVSNHIAELEEITVEVTQTSES